MVMNVQAADDSDDFAPAPAPAKKAPTRAAAKKAPAKRAPAKGKKKAVVSFISMSLV